MAVGRKRGIALAIAIVLIIVLVALVAWAVLRATNTLIDLRKIVEAVKLHTPDIKAIKLRWPDVKAVKLHWPDIKAQKLHKPDSKTVKAQKLHKPGSGGVYQKISDTVTIFRPPVECSPVTCMKSLGGECQPDGTCEYTGPFQPFIDYPHAMATHYCELKTGGCSGAIGDPRPEIKKVRGEVLQGTSPEPPPGGAVSKATVFGVTANPPLMIGNSAVGVNSVTGKRVASSYQGSTAVSGVCYDVEGPGGRAILVAGDRCGGYCKSGCTADGAGAEECGSCVGAVDGEPTPNPPCVGAVPGLYSSCRGESVYGCTPPVLSECDWCASQNHPHFDLDNASYATVCGGDPAGSCELTRVTPFRCTTPGNLPVGGSCPYPHSYDNGGSPCAQPGAQYTGTGGATCCCPWNAEPDPAKKACVAGS